MVMKDSGRPIIKPHLKRMSDEKVFESFLKNYKGKNDQDATRTSIRTAYYLEDFFLKNKVSEFFLKLRKELDLPAEGLPVTEVLLEKVIRFPYHLGDDAKGKLFTSVSKRKNDFLAENLLIQTSLRTHSIASIFLLTNAYSSKFASLILRQEGSVKIIRAKYQWDEVDADSPKAVLESIEKDADFYPVQIGLSTETGLKEINAYLKENWKFIEALLKEEKSEKGELLKFYRSRDAMIRERDTLIYENRHLQRKELTALLYDLGFKDYPDPGAMRKIISVESKKRA